MITAYDKEYKATKRIKQGKTSLESPFDELAEWISATWDVVVLNVVYDHADGLLRAPRIQVILEYQDHAQKFSKGFNFDKKKQKAIAKKFIEIIKKQPEHGYDITGLFVVFSAFDQIAKEEADEQISDLEIEALKAQIANADLWEISRCFGGVTFMFYTDKQVAKYEQNGKKELYARKYFSILKRYDEFSYCSFADFDIQFDSKENFDKNYESNWYYYYK
ncbi:hypothetical protein [uncultured Gimesia sp.]|uniref:hypothetical protein n=1 Tax=uncultured Gimesia sp. TaxID=1678688 RepID=UPI00261759B4|nr:hypothetical protein [uncultured Gimesia sp.]